MVEALVELLKAYSAHLLAGDSGDDTKSFMPDLGKSLNACVGELLAGSNPNGAVFREAGGARVVMELVKTERSRQAALALVQQLILGSGGEDDMTALLELLHSTPKANVELKNDILQTVATCLRESHRARAVFR